MIVLNGIPFKKDIDGLIKTQNPTSLPEKWGSCIISWLSLWSGLKQLF
jgi:hypothetical protein